MANISISFKEKNFEDGIVSWCSGTFITNYGAKHEDVVFVIMGEDMVHKLNNNKIYKVSKIRVDNVFDNVKIELS